MGIPGEKKKEILNRLSRLEGQIRGVRNLIESGEECEKIAVQMSAVHAALEGVTKLIVVGFFRECMGESSEKAENKDEILERFVSLLMNTRM